MSRARTARVIDRRDEAHAKLTQTDFEVADPAEVGRGDDESAGAEFAPVQPSLPDGPEFHAALASHIAQYETEFTRAEAATVRARVLNVPARVSRSGRRRRLHLPQQWPWAAQAHSLWTTAKTT